MAKISVIVLVHNSQKTIRKCMNALINQTYKNFELIIVDDQSTDKTIEIIQSYKDKRITTINNPNRNNIASGRNIGFKVAKGDLIFYTDSDCIPLSNWLEEGVGKINGNDIITGITFYEYPCHSFKHRVVQGWDSFFTCNLGFKKSSLEKINGFDEKFNLYAEDKDVCFRILKNGGEKIFNQNMIVIHQTSLRTPKSELKLYSKFYWGKLLCHFKHGNEPGVKFGIMRPDLLVATIFPPLLLVTETFRSFDDLKLLPFTWIGLVIGRVRMWVKCLRKGKFYL